MGTYTDYLIFDALDGVFDQRFDRLSAGVGDETAVQLFDPRQDVVDVQVVDERSDRLENELDVVDGMALLDGEDHVR